jgi:hypothetical protein
MGTVEEQKGLKWEYTPHEQHNIELSGELWRIMPAEILMCRDRILEDMKRFDLEDITLLMGALVHPGYNSLEWVQPSARCGAIKTFLKEMCEKSGVAWSTQYYSPVNFELNNIENEAFIPVDIDIVPSKLPKFRKQAIDIINNSDENNVEEVHGHEVYI